jgi:hypothetical protein
MTNPTITEHAGALAADLTRSGNQHCGSSVLGIDVGVGRFMQFGVIDRSDCLRRRTGCCFPFQHA